MGKGRQDQVKYLPKTSVNCFISDLDYNQLIGNSVTFNTLTYAFTTIEKIQYIEAI